jgi:hypothetical protein
MKKEIFNTSATKVKTDFDSYMENAFDAETGIAIKTVLHHLGLPLPDTKETFLGGTEGVLLFLEKQGVVVRIEYDWMMRVNNNPAVLQPLASITAGKAIIEVCPGCNPAETMQQVLAVKDKLKKQGLDFWDSKILNTGLLPFTTLTFPKGVPVVIDRPSIQTLSDAVHPIKKFLAKLNLQGDPQHYLYAPLKKSFKSAWPKAQEKPDPEKMKAFWKLCEKNVAKGVLIAGWNKMVVTAETSLQDKQNTACQIGKAYAKIPTPS